MPCVCRVGTIERLGRSPELPGTRKACIRHLIGAKQDHILLHKRKKDARKLVEGCEFAWIGFGKSDVSHRFGDLLRLSFFCSFPALLSHSLYKSFSTSGDSP